MAKARVIGFTGYVGEELARFLLQKGDIEIRWYSPRSHVGQSYTSLYQNIFRIVDADCMNNNMKELAGQVDVTFTATPQGLCVSLVDKDILSKVKVIDLSTDFRIKNAVVYEKQYELTHGPPQFIEEVMYGLPETNKEEIKKTGVIANPRCFPTCLFLSAHPLVKEELVDLNALIIDTKLGTSGTSGGAEVDSLYCEVNGNIKTYGAGSRGHIPEIEERLSYAARKPMIISFTSHLVPVNRRILVIAYASLTKEVTYKQVRVAYSKYYKEEYFVRMLDRDVMPQIRWVEGNNFVDVNLKADPRTSRIVITGAIDNIVKGVTSQAIQNMNLMLGSPGNTGLKRILAFL